MPKHRHKHWPDPRTNNNGVEHFFLVKAAKQTIMQSNPTIPPHASKLVKRVLHCKKMIRVPTKRTGRLGLKG